MIVITGGGTGGHLAIARALAEELKRREIPTIYIGSLYGQDQQWFAQRGQKPESSAVDSKKAESRADSGQELKEADSSALFAQCHFLNTSGVVNKKGMKKLASIYAQLRAAWHVRRIFAKHKVRAVISVGGFSAGPASLAAILCQKPLFIHEQNAITGRLNSLLSPFAKAVFNSFRPPYPPYPISQAALQKPRIRTKPQCIIFIGGSQGAKAINDLALLAAPTLLAKGMRIIHQCGERDFERVRQAYSTIDPTLESNLLESKPSESSPNTQAPSRLTLFGFDSNIIEHLDRADMCVARAGASSIWENTALGLPTLYIPYPYAANNHQYHNAAHFVHQGLALMITEQELCKQKPCKQDLCKRDSPSAQSPTPESTIEFTPESTMDLAKFFALLSQLEGNLTEISTKLIALATKSSAKNSAESSTESSAQNGAESIIATILATLEPSP